MNDFNHPKMPTGYLVFSKKDGNYIGKFLHLSELKKDCIGRNLSPDQVCVFRLYDKGENDEDRKLMFIHEYAFKNRQLITHIGSMSLEEECWTWELPKMKNITSKLIENNNNFEKIYKIRFSKWDYLKFRIKFLIYHLRGYIINISKLF